MSGVFGVHPNGEEVLLHRIAGGGLEAEIITCGAALRALRVPGRNGEPLDIVLGFDTLREYLAQRIYAGATVGRFANRIRGAEFTLNGRRYALDANEGKNTLHGGFRGFDKQNWRTVEASGTSVTLELLSPDGEGGFPGTVTARVKYAIEGNALAILMTAVSDKDTVLELTNHSYFNPGGHASGPVDGQFVSVNAFKYLPTDAENIPLEAAATRGTPLDLLAPKRIGDLLESGFAQAEKARGVDHCFLINGEGYRLAAEAFSEKSGVRMKVFTNRPAMQLYTGGFIPEGLRGKDGAVYGPRSGFCFETGGCPNSPNRPDFPSSVLKAGEEYRHEVLFSF